MNAKPHTHELRIHRSDDGEGQQWIIRYGDTVIRMWNWAHINKEKALRRHIEKCIRKHDKGSVKAGKRVDYQMALYNEYNKHLLKPPTGRSIYFGENVREVWGTDVLEQEMTG